MSKTNALRSLRARLAEVGPYARCVLGQLADDLITSGRRRSSARSEKRFNDPIWKTIVLRDVEIALVELPLLQRLRRIRQLGLAYLIYPSAHHTRFEHSLGTLHVAGRMSVLFTDLPDRAELKDLSRAVRLAALLHDCGHTAFSHVGERALGRDAGIQAEFAAVKRILNEAFPDDVRDDLDGRDDGAVRASHTLAKHGPPIAELISVLFILSEPMENFLNQEGVRRDEIMLIAALVMGRPYKFDGLGFPVYPDFARSIVSGDLDADKLDYVARDAYFTGIPIAADVDRLMSQLALVSHRVRLSDGHELEANLLGLQPAGVSAFEMFVMTRSYMFSRVYQHPKVRVAERRLTRAITETFGTFENEDAPYRKLTLLYGINGDDACIDALDRHARARDGDVVPFAMGWRDARRVLALSLRNMNGYDEENGVSSNVLQSLWANASNELNNDSSAIEGKIAGLLNVPGDMVTIDWQRPPIIKENPAIFVKDHFADELRPIGKAFDIGQLAKAYEDARSLAWVFVDHEDLAMGAAAAATVLNDEFGLVPRIAAVTDAKIDPKRYRAAVQAIVKQSDQRLLSMAAEGIDRSLGGGLYLSPRHIATHLAALGEDAEPKAVEFSERLKRSALTRRHEDDVVAALGVLSSILQFIEITAQTQPIHHLSLDEQEFQIEVHTDLRRQFQSDKRVRFTREQHAPTGRLDLTVSIAHQNVRPVVLELKAEVAKLETSVTNNILQLESYLTDGSVARAGVLFVRYKAHQTKRLADQIEMRITKDATVIFTVGQHVPPASSSKLKTVVN